MRYTYKERVRMAKKLKVFLAVFFAATVFFAGKFIIDKTFADPNYGTATITYNSGTDGQFEGGLTTNTVTYNLKKASQKIVHTPNIKRDGTYLGPYSSASTNTEVVTIPGAQWLHITITFATASKYDSWICLWEGSHSDYTAQNNHSTSLTHKLGNGYHTDSSNTKEYYIYGDSVTIGYKLTTYGGEGENYGFYVVVETDPDMATEFDLGEIVSGEYKEPIGFNNKAFDSWDQDIYLLNSSTTVNATYSDPIASGTYDDVDWIIKQDGTLELGKVGQTQTFTYRATRYLSSYPWYSYASRVNSVRFVGPVNGNGSMAYLFASSYNNDRKTTIDLTGFNTSSVTDMSYMFNHCYTVTTLDFSGFDTSNVTTMSNMFYECKKLTSLDLTSFNTSNVTDMSHMFYGCNSLLSLDITSFNTANVTVMEHLFNGCYYLTSLNISSFNTSSVTDMSYMFGACSRLPNIDLSNLNTGNVTDMSYMFNGCRSLLNINLNSFNTSNVTTMYGMFWGCSGLTSIDLSPLNTANVTYMSSMFSGCSSLTSIDLSPLNTANVTYMSSMFSDCSSLTSIDLSPLNTEKVTDMTTMFAYCTGLTSIDLSPLNTEKVTNMSGMFMRCTNLTSLDVSGFDTSNVTGMSSVFNMCISLTSLDLSTWNTSKVTSMGYMFNNCKNLVSLNVSNFNTARVSDMRFMFYNCNSLTSLDISSFDTSANNGNNFGRMFYALSSLNRLVLGVDCNFKSAGNTLLEGNWHKEGEQTIYDGNTLISTYDGSTMAGVYLRETFNKYAILYSNGDLVFQDTTTADPARGTVVATYAGFINISYISYEDVPWYSNRSLVKKVVFTSTIEPTATAYWFYGMNNLEEIEGMSDYFVLNKVFDATSMFENCSKIRELRFDNVNNTFGYIKYYDFMFAGCTSLEELDLSTFRFDGYCTGNNCLLDTPSLKVLVLGEEGGYYYSGLEGRWVKDGESFIWEPKSLFDEWSRSMAGTYRSPAKYAIVYDNGEMVFQEGSTPDPRIGNVVGSYTGFEDTVYDGSYWNNVPWSDNQADILSVTFKDEVLPISTAHWFSNMTNLTEINNIENLITYNVTTMESMFILCESLTSLDLSSFDTSNVTTMESMFNFCEGLTSLDLSSFDTSSVTNMANMFYACSSITTLDVSNFDTHDVQNMLGMFSSCGSLTTLNLSSFDTSSVTTMEDMFRWSGGLTTLNLSNFNTHNVQDMGGMFDFCKNLTTLNINNFDTSSVTSMSLMFSNCENLTTIDVSGFDTTGVMYMGYMFSNCKNIKSLDISSFDTSAVTEMSSMFSGMNKLNALTLGEDWEFLSGNGLVRSWLRDGDNVLYTATELTNSYVGSTMAGIYRAMETLAINETVRGSLANVNKDFNFTINVTNSGYAINTTQPYTGSKTGNLVFNNGNATFTLKHGETINVYLPLGCYYTISQQADGYSLSRVNWIGYLNSSTTSTFTNTLNGTTPTGIFLDILPYILMIVLGVGSVFIIRGNNA